jgi:hypothetical protein
MSTKLEIIQGKIKENQDILSKLSENLKNVNDMESKIKMEKKNTINKIIMVDGALQAYQDTLRVIGEMEEVKNVGNAPASDLS